MDKIVILGNHVGQYHLYRKIKDYGYEIISIIRKNEDPFCNLYDYIEQVDDLLDTNQIEQRLEKYDSIVAITSLTLEKIVVPLSILCNKRKLPSISLSTATIGTNKYLMIEKFKKYNVPYPKTTLICDPDTLPADAVEMTYPLISKPTDNSAKRGVVKIGSGTELGKKINYSFGFSREKKVLLQEYVGGIEIIASSFIDGDNFRANLIEKRTTDRFVEVYFTAPTSLTNVQKKNIENISLRVMKALNISRGFAHTELKINGNDIFVLETSPRVSIGTVAMSKYHYGFDEAEFVLNFSLNKKSLFSFKEESNRISLIHFRPNIGCVLDIKGIDKIPHKNIKEIVFFKKDGYKSKKMINNDDRIGFVVLENEINILYEDEIAQVKEIEKYLFK